MAYNSRLISSSIQTYPTCFRIVQAYFNLSDSVKTMGNTVGAVVSTAHAFRLADYTADRDSHPALKLCGRKDK